MMEEEIKPPPKTCFNCSTQSANYYQKWRGNVVCHRCYMRLFREKKKNEQAARECLSTDQSMDGTFCLSGDDQNNNNGNEEKNGVMLNTFPIPSDNSSETNNQLEASGANSSLTTSGGTVGNGAVGSGTNSNTKQTKAKASKTNHLVSGLMPPANIDTSMFKKPVSEQEAQASMIKSLNAAHYYAGYYEAMRQFKK